MGDAEVFREGFYCCGGAVDADTAAEHLALLGGEPLEEDAELGGLHALEHIDGAEPLGGALAFPCGLVLLAGGPVGGWGGCLVAFEMARPDQPCKVGADAVLASPGQVSRDRGHGGLAAG